MGMGERIDYLNNLVHIHNDVAVCDSLQVAEKFEKRHADIIRSIEKIIAEQPAQNCVRCFKKTSYTDAKGEQRPMYYMNRDGFTFLVMGFTGQKASEWKWEYIDAFNRMESIIREKATPEWQESRRTGITARKKETDAIKRLCEYAAVQGSTHSKRLYTNYTKLANKAAGITDRTTATSLQISILTAAEVIIAQTISLGIEQNKPYKEIYQDCKAKLNVFQGVSA